MSDGSRSKGLRLSRLLIIALLLQGLVLQALLLIHFSSPDADPNDRAVIYMSTFALWICWIGLCGGIIFLFKGRIRDWVGMRPDSWMAKFMLLGVALLLLEEVFTVTATNMYALFGGEYGQAFITGSDNYLEVVLLHSAIVIWPGILFWALWLKRYAIHPNWALLLFGISGLIGETMFGGLHQLLAVGMWVLTYGLIVYLPAYCLPAERGALNPKSPDPELQPCSYIFLRDFPL